MTNPPFGGIEEPGIETNSPASFQTKETAGLFLVLIMHILKPGGRAAAVVPDGFLFGDGIKARIKEKLLAECDLHSIVRLPNGVFSPYTGIKAGGYNLDRKNPNRTEEEAGDPDELLAKYQALEQEARAARDELKRLLGEALGSVK